MTATYAPQEVQPQPAATVKRRWYRRPLVIIPAAAVTALVIGASVGAALGGSRPANAAAMVKADGYTVETVTLTPAQITAEFGPIAPYVTSAAGGINAQGSAEMDVFMTPQGITLLNTAAAAEGTTVVVALEQAMPGATVTVTGDVLRVDAPESALTGLSG